MKLIKRLIPALVIFIILAIITGFIFLNHIRTNALPDYSKDVSIPGLIDEVVIIRDSFAIPHIYALNDSDLYKATGFTMAQDRLWQMDLLRRITQGRLSEIMGNELVNTDLLMRALRIQEKSEKVLALTSPEIIHALEQFSAGINHYISNFPLPPEFRILGYKPEDWEPVHSVNLIGYMAWDLSSGWGPDYILHRLAGKVTGVHLKDLLPLNVVHSTPVFPELANIPVVESTLLSANRDLEKLGAQIFYGSNNWAVSGTKSNTGKPILANDMHLGLMSPGIWYQMHQVSEEGLNVTGVVLPGQPFVICGHNDSVAWGMTNVTVDDLDFYAEILNQDSSKYLFDGQWVDLMVKEEVIKTREGEEVAHKLRFTHRGPIINRFKNSEETPLSIRWMGNEMSNELRTVYLLNRAADWQDFRNAVNTFRSVSQNIVYADVKGNIGLQTSAGVPLRKNPGTGIYPGDTSLYDWTGFVPFGELPYEFNPAKGYVASANNKTVSENYPYYIGSWFSIPDRINRINELLEGKEKHGIEDFMAMHNDFKSKKAERFVPRFLKALDHVNGEMYLSARNVLEDWDYVMDRKSTAASVFEILYRKVGENLVEDELSPELFHEFMGQRILFENLLENILVTGESVWLDNIHTPEHEDFDDIIIKAFHESVNELMQRLGNDVDEWNWGKLHTVTLSHPLGTIKSLNRAFSFNRGPYGVPGSFHTVTPYSYSFNNLYEVNHGASHRHIYDLSDWNASKTIIPTGTSGIPASDFYLDQLDMFLKNHYHADPFSHEKVENDARFRMKLIP